MIAYYEPEIITAFDYYPFGMMSRMWYDSDYPNYRFGFNGKEMDHEAKGNFAQLDYGFRIYDPRIGRFLSVDPLSDMFPWYTPYQFAGNKPIANIDLDGAEETYFDGELSDMKNGKTLYKIYRGALDGVENIMFITMYPQFKGWLIRKGLEKRGFELPESVYNIQISKLFDIRSYEGDFVISTKGSFWQTLLDLGTAVFQVGGAIPTRGSVYVAAMKVSPLTASTVADIIRGLRINARAKEIHETFKDVTRGGNKNLSKFEAESGSLLEEEFNLTLRQVNKANNEGGDYVILTGALEEGVSMSGKTIDQFGIPASALSAKGFVFEKFFGSIDDHFNKLKAKSSDYLLLDVRALSDVQVTKIMEYINKHFSEYRKQLITIGANR